VTYLILATDMSKHMGLFKQLQQWMANAQDAWKTASSNSMGDKGGSRGKLHNDDDDDDDDDGDGDSDEGLQWGSSHGGGGGGHEPWVKPAIDGASEEDRRLVGLRAS
jgi:hypothetical protein